MSVDVRSKFTQKYGQAYIEQFDELERIITHDETGENRFLVIGIEAGLGKSLETDRIITEYLNKYGQYAKKFLIVKRFDEDVYNSVDSINTNCNISMAAIGITRKNWTSQFKKDPEQIQNYPVVIITHVRYNNLCREPYYQHFFEQQRHILIIDEQIELPVYSFSRETWDVLNTCLPTHKISPKLYAVCDELLDQMTVLKEGQKNNTLSKAKPSINLDNFNKLKDMVKANRGHYKSNDARDKLDRFIDFVESFGQKDYLYNGNRVSTYQGSGERWTLRNNLILDANAGLDKRYNYANDMTVKVFPKILEYSQTVLHPILFNASRNKISKSINYYETISDLIKENHKDNSKTLVVTHLDDEKELIKCLNSVGFDEISVGNDYNGQRIAVAHFGAIIGKNHWRDFNQVWVIATPNLPMEVYPLHWCYFANATIRNHNLKMSSNGNGKYRFHNEKFEDIRFGCIVSEIYQAVKRINRECNDKAEVFVVNSDPDVFDKVAEQLRGVEVAEMIKPDVQSKKDNKQVTLRNGKGSQLASLLRQLAPGEYSKTYLRSKLGWKNDGNFRHYLKDKEIDEMESAGLIEIRHFSIIKLGA